MTNPSTVQALQQAREALNNAVPVSEHGTLLTYTERELAKRAIASIDAALAALSTTEAAPAAVPVAWLDAQLLAGLEGHYEQSDGITVPVASELILALIDRLRSPEVAAAPAEGVPTDTQLLDMLTEHRLTVSRGGHKDEPYFICAPDEKLGGRPAIFTPYGSTWATAREALLIAARQLGVKAAASPTEGTPGDTPKDECCNQTKTCSQQGDYCKFKVADDAPAAATGRPRLTEQQLQEVREAGEHVAAATRRARYDDAASLQTHRSLGNEVTPDGIVHRCSCGWVSRPCFSNAIASNEGQDHRDAAGQERF